MVTRPMIKLSGREPKVKPLGEKLRRLLCVPVLSLAGYCLAPVSSALAVDVEYELRAGVSYSDNVGRVNIDEEDQVIATAGVLLEVSGESRLSEGSLSLDVDYLEYLDDAFDSEVLPRIRGQFTYKPMPGRVHWVTDGRVSQARNNPFDASTPQTREDVGKVSTGPQIIFPIGNRTRLQAQSRLSATFYEDSDADSDSISGGLSLIRAISPNRGASLNASGERVEFDSDQGLSDFERYSLYLQFTSEISRGSLSAQIGANEVHADGQTFDGTLASLSLDRQISPRSSIGLSINQSFTDAGNFFGGLESVFRPGRESSIVPVRDPFETRLVTASYNYDKGRVNLTATVSASDDDYESASSFDSRRLQGTLSTRVELASAWSSRLLLRYEDRDFQTVERIDEYLTAAFSVGKQISRTVFLGFEYRLEDRASDANGQDYTENRYTLQLRFSPRR